MFHCECAHVTTHLQKHPDHSRPWIITACRANAKLKPIWKRCISREVSRLIGHSHGIWNNKDLSSAGQRVGCFHISFLISFPNEHTLCVCEQTALLHVLQTMTQTSTRSHGSAGQAGAQTQEVHTDTTANKPITTNPQRMQKAKIKSSCDSRN